MEVLAAVCKLVLGLFLVMVPLLQAQDHIRCPDISPCKCRIRNKRREHELKALDIDCRNRNLKVFPDLSALRGMPINVLQITYNKIKDLPSGALEGLHFQSVQSHGTPPLLRLDGNPFSTVSSNAFRGLRADKGLLFSMEYCNLQTLPVEALRHLHNVTQLHLSDNNLTHVPGRAFAGLHKLEMVSLNNNPLHRLHNHTFSGAHMLHDLTLKNISLRTFPANALKRLRALKTVYLNGNSITSLPANTFEGFQTDWEEVFVSLVNNGLKEIHPQAFNRENTEMSLATLHLENNLLTDLSFLYKPCDPVFRERGFSLYIDDNPVQCNCEFYTLASAGLYSMRGTCGKAENFHGLQFDTKWKVDDRTIFKGQFGEVAYSECGEAGQILRYRICEDEEAEEEAEVISIEEEVAPVAESIDRHNDEDDKSMEAENENDKDIDNQASGRTVSALHLLLSFILYTLMVHCLF